VLPGTGGLTRLVDKRHVRRDLADVFATRAEGVYGVQALRWGLVDEVVPRSRFAAVARERALEAAARSDRPRDGAGIKLTPLERRVTPDVITYPHVQAMLDRALRTATILVEGPNGEQPSDPTAIRTKGAAYWPLAVGRALDDLILHLRFNEPELGTIVLKTEGDLAATAAVDATLLAHADHWLVREIVLFLKRTLKRLDVTSRSLVALVDPGSCFAGTLLELALAADRSYMLDGAYEDDSRPAPEVVVTGMNLGPLPMSNGITRLESRFLGHPDQLRTVEKRRDERLDAPVALELGLVTFAPDDLDWDDEVRLGLEERAGFSPDALSGMEANNRFAGPETPESKIFARLSAWQNWIFQRPNAVGPEGALRRYGTGTRPVYDHGRV
jgi:benzoyl-CoA-dihydrodiol lyase